MGDGINDSISLVTADIGVSISSGTDIAMDSASVILMNDNIEKINEIFNENDIDKKMKELDVYQGDLYKK